ncbi:glycoside hydrolase [Parachaetomium inaequale]|uniref:Glycoside hydrolase n=1 Tax=Parachaetomium inaequale TaxID=2588326 RepID=A0AAN6SM72_9PEZI|nr:glycoside hydrolase [Parachaetomium inaequale]
MNPFSLFRMDVIQEEHFVHDVPGTYPRLCRLSDGSILAGYTAFEPDGRRVLTVARSTDDARTFAPHGEVARSFGDCDNLCLLELPPASDDEGDDDAASDTPTILAAFRNHDIDGNGTHTYFRITVCQSTDGGRTWTYLAQGSEKEAPFGLWEPFLRMSTGGDEIHLYFSQEMDVDDQDTMLVRSKDGGATWTATQRVTGEGEMLRDGMVGLAEARDEASGVEGLVLVMETTRRGTFSIEAVVSLDEAETFGSRQVVYEPRDGRNAGAPQITAFADGSLAVVFMTDEDKEGEPVWPGGAKIKAIYGLMGADGLLNWSPPMVIGDTKSMWPGIMRVGDNAAMAVYESCSSIRGRMLSITPR